LFKRVAGVLLALAAVAVVGYAGLMLATDVFVDRLFDREGNEKEIPCDDFEFDRQAWLNEPYEGWAAPRTITERERQGSALIRCGTLQGMPRAEVEAMLGKGFVGKNTSRARYYVGWVNDGLGVGDGFDLTVDYDERGRVRNLPPGGYAPGP
jgi:hypothetical protein